MKYLALIITMFISFAAFAEQSKEDTAKQQEMMKKYQEYNTPSEAHKMLATLAGKWTYTSKIWQDPHAKPMESKGKSTLKMIMDGRYLQHEVSGQMMGTPFKGIGFTGYDNLKKVYQTSWMDNMGTAMMVGKGSYDATTKTLTDKGEFTCPIEEDHTGEFRNAMKIIDKNNFTFTMYGTGGGVKEEFKMMEMAYKRVR